MLISCCIVFLLITSLRHVKLRAVAEDVAEDVVEDIAPVQGGEDYDANLTEEETAILSRSFRSTDFDNDGHLSETEMSMAISRATKLHITVRQAELVSLVTISFIIERNEEQLQGVLLA